MKPTPIANPAITEAFVLLPSFNIDGLRLFAAFEPLATAHYSYFLSSHYAEA